MSIKIGINGMGRIGRMIIRSIIENNNKNIEIKHINNRTNSEACSTLLKYDNFYFHNFSLIFLIILSAFNPK